MGPIAKKNQHNSKKKFVCRSLIRHADADQLYIILSSVRTVIQWVRTPNGFHTSTKRKKKNGDVYFMPPAFKTRPQQFSTYYLSINYSG